MERSKAVLALATMSAFCSSGRPGVWGQAAPPAPAANEEKVYSYAPSPDALYGANPQPLGPGKTFPKKKLYINGTGPSNDLTTLGDSHAMDTSNTKIYDRDKKKIYDYPNDLPGVTATREMRKAGARPGDMAKVCAGADGSTTCAMGPIYDTYNGSNNHAEITPKMAENLNIPLTATSDGYVPTQDMNVDVTVYPGSRQDWGFDLDKKTFVYMTPPQDQIDYYSSTLPPPGQ